jgi:hypothetical protein
VFHFPDTSVTTDGGVAGDSIPRRDGVDEVEGVPLDEEEDDDDDEDDGEEKGNEDYDEDAFDNFDDVDDDDMSNAVSDLSLRT